MRVKGTINPFLKNQLKKRLQQQFVSQSRSLARQDQKPLLARRSTSCLFCLFISSLGLPACLSTSTTDPHLRSFIPTHQVESFIYEKLDLASFRNSLGPSRMPNTHHFSEWGIQPTKIEEGRIEMETCDWFYSIQIIDRRDVNKDGLEDLLIEFFDAAKHGTYRTRNRYLVTRYSSGSCLIAIAFEPPSEESH